MIGLSVNDEIAIISVICMSKYIWNFLKGLESLASSYGIEILRHVYAPCCKPEYTIPYEFLPISHRDSVDVVALIRDMLSEIIEYE